MSERHTGSHEDGSEQHVKSVEVQARQKELLDEAKKEAALSHHEHQEKLNEIRNEIHETASTAAEMTKAESETRDEPEAANTYWNSHEYREMAFKQLMTKVRKNLNGPERVASKLFHQPLVERASEVGSKTIARPSGVLVGSIFSFITSLITYILAKQNGYDMSYSIFIMSFIGGFILGVIAEFAYRVVRTLMARD